MTSLTNDNYPDHPPLADDGRPSIKDIAEVLWLPALCVAVTATLSWLIWYYTSVPCTADLSRFTGCSPAPLARYITIDIFGRIITYSAITGAGGGVWNWNMISKERAARRAAETRAAEVERALAEERKRADEERQAFWTMLTEERQRADEERQQAAKDRADLMAMVTGLIARIDERQNGNGNHAGAGDSSG